jgi:hypothetical protein
MCHALQSMRRELYQKKQSRKFADGSPQRGPKIRSSTVTELSKHHRTLTCQEEPATVGPFSSLGPAGCWRAWLLADALMISAIVHGDTPEQSEGICKQIKRDRTPQLYDLPCHGRHLRWHLSLLHPPSSACRWPVSASGTSIFDAYAATQCFLSCTVSNRAYHLSRLIACSSRSGLWD